MNTSTSLSVNRHGSQRSLRASFLLAAAAVLTVTSAATSGDAPAEPPAFPDIIHVSRGCYLSTVAYIARFTAEYPAESAQPLTVTRPDSAELHTIAVLTWKGRWWGRDEYWGVFALGCSVTEVVDGGKLRDRAGSRLRGRASRDQMPGWGAAKPRAVTALSGAMREREIANAATVVPGATIVVRVRCQGVDVPFLFFQPNAGRVAVYDPVKGTASAHCAADDVVAVVTHVATQLGYRVDPESHGTAGHAGSRSDRIAGKVR